MKIGELIAILQEFDPEQEVCVATVEVEGRFERPVRDHQGTEYGILLETR